jgi:hypothetical protein
VGRRCARGITVNVVAPARPGADADGARHVAPRLPPIGRYVKRKKWRPSPSCCARTPPPSPASSRHCGGSL